MDRILALLLDLFSCFLVLGLRIDRQNAKLVSETVYKMDYSRTRKVDDSSNYSFFQFVEAKLDDVALLCGS